MERNILISAEKFAKDFFSKDSTGHDWFHTERVRNQAVSIAEEEGASSEICELAALLHDIGDGKFHDSEASGRTFLENWLLKQPLSFEQRENVLEIISTVSFKGGFNTPPSSLEAKVVHDADRLDAIGAIGIARCFMFAGNKNHVLHEPEKPAREIISLQEYRDSNSSAIDHFYEKLLKLKELMMTGTGRRRAEKRHERLEAYLENFFDEWKGNT